MEKKKRGSCDPQENYPHLSASLIQNVPIVPTHIANDCNNLKCPTLISETGNKKTCIMNCQKHFDRTILKFM